MTTQATASPLLRGLAIQKRVINAIILREVRTRFGRHRLGYLWAFAESLFWVLTFAGIYHFMGRTAPSGMDMFGFLATGIVTFVLFRSTAMRCQASILGNRPLLFFPQVRPVDIVLARSALEAVTVLTVFVGLLSANALLVGYLDPANLLAVVTGLAAAWLLGLGLGTSLMGLSVFFPITDQLVPIVMRPMFILSGLFFAANELPPEVRDILLYNPVLHAVETVRGGWFVGYDARHVDGFYLGCWILGLLYFGLLLERFARRRLELT